MGIELKNLTELNLSDNNLNMSRNYFAHLTKFYKRTI